MAKYNKALGVSFNDNDGGATWFTHSQTASDITRHYEILGRWGCRIYLLKKCWVAIKTAERMWAPKKLPLFRKPKIKM